MGDLAVSVLVPSRRRTGLLGKTVTSLAVTAADPAGVEVLVAADPGDTQTQEFRPAPGLAVRVLTAPQRWGRGSVHEYYNWLAPQARGMWLLVWNDDAVMETGGWDQVIAALEPGAVPVASNHGDHMFIAVPAVWAKAAGFLSPTPDVDNFLYTAGERLGCVHRAPLRAFHDVHYITGRNGDETYWEGRADQDRVDRAGWDVLFGDGEQAMAHMCAAIRGLPA